jgi:uncharacterized protein (TIGR00661 family)
MKILYAIQGTGNGHLSRAKDVIPALKSVSDVDILVSGIQADIQLPFEIKYKYYGMSFIFGKSGGVDLWKTWKSFNFRMFVKEISQCPVDKYDLVINDFEPISAWASYFKKVKCISLSHQCALLSPNVPKPDSSSWLGWLILRKYAPTSEKIGFHFKKYDSNIYTPVIRKEIRSLLVTNLGHYTVYLPAYSDERIINVLSKIDHVYWEVFSKHTTEVYQVRNVLIKPINGEAFAKSMASAEGVFCGAGFETPAEALFLGKKLLVLPMKSQFEQHINAAGLKDMGVPVLKSLKKKHALLIQNWVDNFKPIQVNFPDQTQFIVEEIVKKYQPVSKTIPNQSYSPNTISY